MTDLDPAIIYGYASDLLKEDLGRGDVTTRALVRPSVRARGRFLAKQDFILCGLEVAEAVFASLDVNIGLESRAYDGDSVREGTEFANIEGPAWVILAAERTALNILQRMSGVATLTRAFVDAIAGTAARITDTRKTTPGIRLLEKYAVTVGGGRNHRFGLDDGILIKDNHITLAGGVRRAVEAAREAATHLMKIEVEVGNESQVREAVAARADVIMLDNMPTDQVRDAVRLIREQAPDTIIEASGGITLMNVRQIAECGVDLVSVGAITHSAGSVDISLKLTPVR
ncbi:MAG TPA: carboxylating nicotinate-nucleotide diphosphorylase [Blastocatellia bacterium]|nr:carboxylating nicotinate-nucleotide diphosphorylase [Blastocatellia bacterium]